MKSPQEPNKLIVVKIVGVVLEVTLIVLPTTQAFYMNEDAG